MAMTTEGISNVRALPVALNADADGTVQAEPGFAEVVFASTADGMHHQVYVDGRLAGVTVAAEERSVIVPAVEHAASLVEVIAVDAADRLTDYAASLSGWSDAAGSRISLAWYGGRYLDDTIDHFDVFAGPPGAIDTQAPLNAEPIPATVEGESQGGFGRGPFGRGGFGRSATRFTFTTPKLAAGVVALEVVAVDAAGNATGGAVAQVVATVPAPLRPPSELAVVGYDDATQTAALSWTPSPDL